MNLQDKVAVITGAASGIGKNIAKVFLDNGAKVVIADLDMKSAQATALEFDPSGLRAMAVAMDVTSEAEVEAGIAAVAAQFGGVDVLVSNKVDHQKKPENQSKGACNRTLDHSRQARIFLDCST